MKFLLFVEGHTEKTAVPRFLKSWLDKQLTQPVGIQAVRFSGWAEFDREVRRKVKLHLQGPKSNQIIRIIGLIDLYGPTIFPDGLSWQERYEWGVKHYEHKVDDIRFQMHFAVHELEAWILSQPNLLPRSVSDALPKSITQPELVNFNEPPAKLLDRVYRQQTRRGYKKTTYGNNLFSKLDPDVAAEKCPKLKSLLESMRAAAKEQGL